MGIHTDSQASGGDSFVSLSAFSTAISYLLQKYLSRILSTVESAAMLVKDLLHKGINTRTSSLLLESITYLSPTASSVPMSFL